MDAPSSETSLTRRQLQVLELIERRLSRKEIAAELDLSVARIDELIRALKDHFGVNALSELAACHREMFGEQPPSKTLPSKAGVPGRANSDPEAPPNDVAAAEPRLEPRVVPEVLDGKRAGFKRLVAIGLMWVGLLMGIILSAAAYDSVTGLAELIP